MDNESPGQESHERATSQSSSSSSCDPTVDELLQLFATLRACPSSMPRAQLDISDDNEQGGQCWCVGCSAVRSMARTIAVPKCASEPEHALCSQRHTLYTLGLMLRDKVPVRIVRMQESLGLVEWESTYLIERLRSALFPLAPRNRVMMMVHAKPGGAIIIGSCMYMYLSVLCRGPDAANVP